MSEYSKQYYKDNREVLLQKRKEYRERNKEIISQKNKEYLKKYPPEKKKASQRKYYRKNKSEIFKQTNLWRENNREKVRDQQKKGYIKNKDKRLFQQKRCNIGISLTYDEYVEYRTNIDNKCEICGQEERTQSLSIDHCHTKKVFRGLLCRSCNVGIGMLKDDVALLNSAIKYITKPQSKR